jgi:exopolyphosphatase/guanosine-5'-triphosphate,3'-diphosphate pyrophosphatase
MGEEGPATADRPDRRPDDPAARGGEGQTTAPPVAALDCGTNSTRLLVTAADGAVLERHMRVTRLGEGVDATHKLNAEAIARTLAVLADYRVLMDGHGVGRARLVATSAARDAANVEEFFSAAQRVSGVEPELLSGLEEGRLSFAGATAHLPPDADPGATTMVVDIGGGSTELAAGVPGRTDTVAAVSLDIGCVRITERFFEHDPPTAAELGRARTAIDATLRAAAPRLPTLAPGGTVIGLAGTVSTLASLVQGLAVYDRERVHHARLRRAQVDEWLAVLASEDTAARRRRAGMLPGRADVIVGGVLVLAAVMADWDRAECLVSEDDILDGLVASLR